MHAKFNIVLHDIATVCYLFAIDEKRLGIYPECFEANIGAIVDLVY